MAVVALLVHPARPEAAVLAGEAVRRLEADGHEARLLAGGAEGAEPAAVADVTADELAGTDLAVSIGGDGTFLRLVAVAHAARVPVLGVNLGRLGYLLEVAPERLTEVLQRALAGELATEERTVVSVTTRRAAGGRWVALNEVVVQKTAAGHMVHLVTSIDGEPFLSYFADGVLVAAPTGSTAYNLSAGGPIISPLLRCMVLTPVAPHLSVGSSVVLHPDQVVAVEVAQVRPAVLVVDGREVAHLSPGEVVEARVDPEPLRMLALGERGFVALLRSTLAPRPAS